MTGSALPARLALFDLDDTLLPVDSDSLWSTWLGEVGAVDPVARRAQQRHFGAQYVAGTLDIGEFMAFQLAPLAAHPRAQLDRWLDTFVRERIRPIVTPAARACVARHRGDLVALVTATNSWLAGAIAREFGIAHVIATTPEVDARGEFTGRVAGVPAFRDGKVTRVDAWLAALGATPGSFAESWFYSDSRNDLPLLGRVTHPVAVDADPVLAAHARAHGWRTLTLRDTTTLDATAEVAP
jgi:HAD superfamily hydrolase (TIGR01490 family)